MAKNKHNSITKKGPTKAPHGQVSKRPTKQKWQGQDDDVLSSNEVKILSQKRQKKKAPEEITVKSNDEDPGVSRTDGFKSNYGNVEQSIKVRVTSIIWKFYIPINGLQGDLDKQHSMRIGEQLSTKSDMTKDLDLMFLKPGKAKFRETEDDIFKGHWCITCK